MIDHTKEIVRKVLNREESIDFKTFCEGGSPEYISAKQKLKDLHLQYQKEYLSRHRNLTAYSLYINPLEGAMPYRYAIPPTI
jgi:hypothetical protein